MTKKQLERLLNDACDIIIELEHNADAEQRDMIEALFNEIKYSDKIDNEMKLRSADNEAQDWDTFGDNKI